MAQQAVSQVMTRNPTTLEATATLAKAARKMRDEDIGGVLVVDDGRLRGIVTDRDITVRATADGKDPNETTLEAVISGELVTIAPDRPIDEAVKLMRKHAIRRLPVVDGGKPVGVVTIGDLAVEQDPRSGLADISAADPNR